MSMDSVPVLDIDFRGEEFTKDPYPTFAYIRENYPVARLRDGTHILGRFRDVSFALKRYDIFASGWPSAPIAHQPWLKEEHQRGDFLTETDPPLHSHYSTMIRGPFVGKGLSARLPFISELAKDLASRITPEISLDFFDTFAYPYFAGVLDSITGLDSAENIERTMGWVSMAQSFTPEPPTTEQLAAIEKVIVAQNHYYEGIVADRRKCPRHDLASVLANQPVNGEPLTLLQLRGALNLFTIGGIEAPAEQTANALIILSERPDLFLKLKSDHSQISPFIEEMLRHFNITNGLMRIAKEDVELYGKVIPKGAIVMPLVSSANRDEEQFEKPDEFILHRSNIKTHIGFGHGPHTCIGQALAREQMRIAITEIVSRFSAVECPKPSELVWKSSLVGRFVKALPVTFRV